MTLEDLRRALASAEGEAASTCRAVMGDPDAIVHLDWAERHGHTSSLLTIYRRRADHVEAIGLPTLGFREAIHRLEQTCHETLRLAGAEGPTGYPWCLVFLAPDEPEVVASLAVLGTLEPP